MTLKLTDIKPDYATFKLSQHDKTFTLRPITLNDEIWMQKRFGDKLASIFETQEMEGISQIVFHQLTDKDKEFFVEKKIVFINEDTGQRTEEKRGGYRLLMGMIVGIQDKIEILNALMVTIGVSRKAQDELLKDKQPKKKQKKKLITPKS